MVKQKALLSLAGILTVLGIAIFSFYIAEDLPNTLTGRTITRAYIIETPPGTCEVNLSIGLNLASFYCETGERHISNALTDENNNVLNYEAIFKYNPGNEDKPWSSYNPSLPNWTIQDLNNLNRRHGYWIIMEQPGTYYREGFDFLQTNIQLKTGWNLIGYPTKNEREIEEALSQINETYTRVEAYTDVNGTKTWLYHVLGEPGTLENMTPGLGYWVYAEQDTSWFVNW